MADARERGFFTRAADLVRSWFGDQAAGYRTMLDDREGDRPDPRREIRDGTLDRPMSEEPDPPPGPR